MDEYVPLPCEGCGRDILIDLDTSVPRYIVSFVRASNPIEESGKVIKVFVACKGECDRKVERKYINHFSSQYKYVVTGWEDVSSIAIPPMFLRWSMSVMNQLFTGSREYEESAFVELKEFIIALSQKVLRETSEREFEKFAREVNLRDNLIF